MFTISTVLENYKAAKMKQKKPHKKWKKQRSTNIFTDNDLYCIE